MRVFFSWWKEEIGLQALWAPLGGSRASLLGVLGASLPADSGIPPLDCLASNGLSLPTLLNLALKAFLLPMLCLQGVLRKVGCCHECQEVESKSRQGICEYAWDPVPFPNPWTSAEPGHQISGLAPITKAPSDYQMP